MKSEIFQYFKCSISVDSNKKIGVSNTTKINEKVEVSNDNPKNLNLNEII